MGWRVESVMLGSERSCTPRSTQARRKRCVNVRWCWLAVHGKLNVDGEWIELLSWRGELLAAAVLVSFLLAATFDTPAKMSSVSVSGIAFSLPAGILLRVKLVEVLLSGLESLPECLPFPIE